MLQTIKKTVLSRGSNKSSKKNERPCVPKNPNEAFLLVVSHFVTDQPVGFDDIMACYESFPDLKNYMHALKSTGVIKLSERDPEKFEFTPHGYQWAKDTLQRLKLKPEQWARANAHFSSSTASIKPTLGR